MAAEDDIRAINARLAAAMARAPHVGGAALFQECEIEMTEAKALTPVDTGALRASGHVEAPVIDGHEAVVKMGFGGPAASYAVIVHEDLEAHHKVGQAKYLEQPLNESLPHLPARIAARIDLLELMAE